MRVGLGVAVLCMAPEFFAACGGTAVSEPQQAAKASAAPATASRDSVSEARAAFYRKAFPDAQSFTVKRVPPEFLPAEDKGNETYLEVRNARQDLIGYLRDFAGPVSPSEACPCSPLSLTLALEPDLKVRTLLSEAPLEKFGHQAMTAEDMARLIAIVKSPAPALVHAPRVEDMVDGVSGATKKEYQELVVKEAALTTRRLVGLAQDTARVISGGALARDQLAIRALLQGETDPAKVAVKLADFFPKIENPEVAAQAYDAIARYYAQALSLKAPPERSVEERLLAAATSHPDQLAKACQSFATDGIGLWLVQDCIRRLEPAQGVDPTTWALLRGTEAFASGRMADAIDPLRQAASILDHNQDPALHLRLVQALKTQNQNEEACRRLKPLYRDHSRLPGIDTLLPVCGGSPEALVQTLREERHKMVLAGRRADDAPVPALSILDQGGLPREVNLAKDGKPTVLIFFAAWCPHCQNAFPQFKSVASTVKQDPKFRDEVRVIGVRTFTEREQEPYSAFTQRFAPNFEVWTDGPQGASLRAFAQRYGFPGSIPRLLVLDGRGALRFIIESDGYRDLAQEMLWAAEAVVR